MKVCLFLGDEWNSGGLELGRAHIHGDFVVGQQSCFDDTGKTAETKPVSGVRFASQRPYDTPHTISALLDLGAVGIENPIACIERCVIASCDPHELVKARTVGRVGETP